MKFGSHEGYALAFNIFSDAHFEACHDHTAREHLQILVTASQRNYNVVQKLTSRSYYRAWQSKVVPWENQVLSTRCFVKL